VAALGPRARVTTTAEAIDASDLVILAVPNAATASIARSVPDWGDGRILVDATKPLPAAAGRGPARSGAGPSFRNGTRD
jgi:predicted dinucleotide-binding enzyme